ncbi:type II toxin-antitoxin system HicB family antitoxin [Saccharibacillus sacchari]|uniref:Type II toxin-antitoxin system HicB family antitoxin n=1 Tax=Saccharibacillus sacchari TaxID=456493 RepID=A0ACC6PHG2_9BACL
MGHAEFDNEARILHGEIVNIRDTVTFQASSADELEKAFRDSVDDYLEFCEEEGEEPNKPFSGKLLLRLAPEQHRSVATAARIAGKSINSWIAERISEDAEAEIRSRTLQT